MKMIMLIGLYALVIFASSYEAMMTQHQNNSSVDLTNKVSINR